MGARRPTRAGSGPSLPTPGDDLLASLWYHDARAVAPGEEEFLRHSYPKLKQAVEQAGDSPVRLMDPETQRTYVLLSAEVFDRLLDEEDRREQEAFLKAAKKHAKARLREDA